MKGGGLRYAKVGTVNLNLYELNPTFNIFPSYFFNLPNTMWTPAKKRRRTEADSTESEDNSLSAQRAQLARDRIHDLDVTALREIALHAYISNTDLAAYIDKKYRTSVPSNSTEPAQSFHANTEACWEMLNVTYPALKEASETTLYELRTKVLDFLSKHRRDILDSASLARIWETRRNAIEALRKICRNILLCSDTDLQIDIVEDKKTLPAFADAMCYIADGMTDVERFKYKNEGLCEKLGQLKDECDSVTHIPALEKLLDLFQYVHERDPARVTAIGETVIKTQDWNRRAFVRSFTGGRKIFQLPVRGTGSDSRPSDLEHALQ